MASAEKERGGESVQPSKQPGKKVDQAPKIPADQQGAGEESLDLDNLELSDTWRELLGIQEGEREIRLPPGSDAPLPTLESDPWNELVHAKGVEVVDLRKLHPDTAHAPLSEKDVEQALQNLQENPADDTSKK
ncbi:MAG: hypothetical protein M3Z08_06185 [Chloroflexota bacterium]|nr:hypothetical protein [Chloroflexota bacterium]